MIESQTSQFSLNAVHLVTSLLNDSSLCINETLVVNLTTCCSFIIDGLAKCSLSSTQTIPDCIDFVISYISR